MKALNEYQEKAIQDLRDEAYNIRLRYYTAQQTLDPIFNKMKFKKKSKYVAYRLKNDLNTLLDRIDQLLEITNFESIDDKERFIKNLSEEYDIIIFYIGRVSAQLEIDNAYQKDVRALRANIDSIEYWLNNDSE